MASQLGGFSCMSVLQGSVGRVGKSGVAEVSCLMCMHAAALQAAACRFLFLMLVYISKVRAASVAVRCVRACSRRAHMHVHGRRVDVSLKEGRNDEVGFTHPARPPPAPISILQRRKSTR